MVYIIQKRSVLAVATQATSGVVGEIETEFSNLIDFKLRDSALVRHQECAACHRPCCSGSVFIFQFGEGRVLLAGGERVFKEEDESTGEED